MCDFFSRNKDLFEELDKFIDSIKDKNDTLMITLHEAQKIFGYLPKEVQNYIAEKLNVSCDKIYSLVNFYDFFHTELKGEYKINVCVGTACSKNNSKSILCEFEELLGINTGETTSDMKFSLSSSRCIGVCRKTPIVTVNGKVYESVTIEDVPFILEIIDR